MSETKTSINPEIITEEERQKAELDAQSESQMVDRKQHADKLIQGFADIDSNASNRAIWELVQNACDLTKQCQVTIDYSKNGFSFSHNGKPFKSSTLISLIKQVSSKYDGDEVGKFGTGFITTHAFGRKFRLDSCLEVQGRFLKINNFLIDRSPMEWKGMAQNLIDQEKEVYKIIKHGEILQGSETQTKTVFTYLPDTETERDYIKDSQTNLHTYIPIVLTLSERLLSVTVIDEDGNEISYAKNEKVKKTDFYVTTIKSSNGDIEVFSLKDDNDEIEIILPLRTNNEAFEFSNKIAKLFLYYPLIGSEEWGCNFLIHSKKFAATEPRDGIHLKSKTEQVQQDENNNREIIAKASKMIFAYVNNHAQSISNPIYLSRINFNVSANNFLLNEYFQGLKDLWIEKFKTYSLVETDAGNLEPSLAAFIHDELLYPDSPFDSIYTLVSKYWKNLPKKEFIGRWTEIVNEWCVESISYITIKDLASKIQEDGNIDKFEKATDLQALFKYLIDNGHAELFSQYKLLPNIKGEFRQLQELNNNINLPDILIDIADIIMPAIPKRHINPDFKFQLEITPYNRKNYTTDINAELGNVIKDSSTSKDISEQYLSKLIEFCKLTTTTDTNSAPSRLIKLECRYYKQDEEMRVISPTKEDELDVRSAQRRLIRLFLNDISKQNSEWVLENLEFLRQVIEIGAPYYDYEEMFKTLAVFPNELNELAVHSTLQISENIPEEIKDLYDKVVKPNLPIRARLVLSVFSDYLKNKEKRTVRSLTEKIESIFSNDGQYSNINEHPFKNEILGIINKISNDIIWKAYFPVINSKRAYIMLDRVTDDQIKGDVFSIVSLDSSKINLLGDLARNENLQKIIELGQEALIQEQQKRSDFQHKYTIGRHIENILRQNIKDVIPENINAIVQDVQDGQDIIIKINDKPVYFIEVKSRWDSNNPVRMSKNQTVKANKEKDHYALCCVDMTKYTGANKYQVDIIEEIRNLIRFNKDIGEKVEHLIDFLKQTDESETIHLDGDYRTFIPQTYIESGIELDAFDSYLIDFLNNQPVNDDV